MKTICYISNVDKDLNTKGIKELCDFVELFNNNENISGVLIIRNKHFFQIIEGEEVKIDQLYSRIMKDTRHNGIIKLVDAKIKDRVFDDFNTGKYEIIIKDNKALKKLSSYLNWINLANHKITKELAYFTSNFLRYNT